MREQRKFVFAEGVESEQPGAFYGSRTHSPCYAFLSRYRNLQAQRHPSSNHQCIGTSFWDRQNVSFPISEYCSKRYPRDTSHQICKGIPEQDLSSRNE